MRIVVTRSSASRERNPRGEGSRLRVELLEAAAELMAQHGSIDKVGVRAVAAAVGVSPTAVYRHFDDHDDLLWSAVGYCFEQFAQVMIAATASTDDVYERLVRAGDAYVDFAMRRTGMYRVMFSNRVPLPEREEPVGMHTFDHLVGIVRDIFDANGDDRDPRFVAVEVWTWIHGIVDLVGAHPDAMEWPPVASLLTELCARLDLDQGSRLPTSAGANGSTVGDPEALADA